MKKAIIYVRGHKQEMQEVLCMVYAADKGYKVLFVTDDIKAVNNCDILIVARASRISRDKFKYYEILNDLKARDIKVEIVANQNNVDDCLSFAEKLLANDRK